MSPPGENARKLFPKGMKGQKYFPWEITSHWNLNALSQKGPGAIPPILLEWIHLSIGPRITKPHGPDS